MKNILITGGPVHEHLDAVKIITNRFRGGLMARLAQDFVREYDAKVTYLCSPMAGAKVPEPHERLEAIPHWGFRDYMEKVLELAPGMDAVILGAAVANLIPAKPIEGKFPSHNYKPGDIVRLDFMIAPRIIDEVKKVAPKTHLFGYKLLSGVSHQELVAAAYGVLLEAKATAVIANDEKKGLLAKYAVTKERGVHSMHQDEQAAWIWQLLQDEYYLTQPVSAYSDLTAAIVGRVKSLIARYHGKFVQVETGLIFGTVAIRHGNGFVTTGRGKRELDDIAYVRGVDARNRVVFASAEKKASLNAPLLAKLFENKAVDHIVHYHEQVKGLPVYPYAPPGTVRDTERPNHTSFNIEEHGCMLLFDKDGRQL